MKGKVIPILKRSEMSIQTKDQRKWRKENDSNKNDELISKRVSDFNFLNVHVQI